MRFLAKTAAYLLHPLFMPVYVVLFLMSHEPVMSLYFHGELKWRFTIVILLLMVMGPLLSVWALRRNGWVESMELPTLKGRSLVYGVTALWYVMAYVIVGRIGLPSVTKALFISLIACLIVLTVVSLKHKTSAHMAAMGGALGVLLWMMTFYGMWHITWFVTLLVLTALQASSRLFLQAHTEREVFTGLLIGVSCTFLYLFFTIG